MSQRKNRIAQNPRIAAAVMGTSRKMKKRGVTKDELAILLRIEDAKDEGRVRLVRPFA